MEGGGEIERRGEKKGGEMKRWICWTDKSTRHR